MNEKHVHARAFADGAARIERDALGVAVEEGFHANELRVHVIGGSFGHGRESVWRDAGPGADAYFDTLGERFRAEIRAPGPTRHINVDWGVERIDADLAVAPQDDGLDVAGVHFVEAHQFGCGTREIIEGKGQVHAVNFRGVDQALHVLAKAENGGPLLGFVAADAFKDGGAVAHHVRKHVQGGVVPVDPLSVMPDFFGLLDGHDGVLLGGATRGEARNSRIRYATESVNKVYSMCRQVQ